jgi:ComF family protein
MDGRVVSAPPGTLRRMLRTVLDVLFPRTCLGCSRRGWPFCPACTARVAGLGPPWCRRCGRPLEREAAACRDCPPPPIAWARAFLLYEGPVRRALMRFKFGGERSAADPLGAGMAGLLRMASPPAVRGPPPVAPLPEPAPPAITWVPLGPSRRRARGYDQAELLARAVGRHAGLPVRRMLARTRDTAPQARRAALDRRSSLMGAFRAAGKAPSSVILVDDVLTTGATAATCAAVLLSAGAREVGLLTAARSLGGTVPSRCYNPAGLLPGSVVARETFSR